MDAAEWAHVVALREVCREREIPMTGKLSFNLDINDLNTQDGFGLEGIDFLLKLLVDTPDPRVDAAFIFLTNKKLCGDFVSAFANLAMKAGQVMGAQIRENMQSQALARQVLPVKWIPS